MSLVPHDFILSLIVAPKPNELFCLMLLTSNLTQGKNNISSPLHSQPKKDKETRRFRDLIPITLIDAYLGSFVVLVCLSYVCLNIEMEKIKNEKIIKKKPETQHIDNKY